MANLRTSGVFNLGALGGDGAVIGGDANWSDVTLLLDGSGSTDLSSASPTITPSSSAPTAGNSGGKHGQYIEFNGSNNYYNVALNQAIGGSGDPFTVECWVYFDSTANDGAFQLLRSGSTLDGSADSNTVSLAVAAYQNKWQIYDDTGGNALSSVATGTWYHVAFVYDGNDLVFYVDGSAELTKSNWTANLSSTGYPNIAIGGYYSTGFTLDGRIEDFRVTKGVARDIAAGFSNGAPISGGGWDASFPKAPVAGAKRPTRRWGGMTGRSLVESTAATAAIPQGSTSFDGSNDYIEVGAQAQNIDLSGAFTIEAWVRLNSTSGNQKFFDLRTNTVLLADTLLIDYSNGFRCFVGGNNQSSNPTATVNTWHHIAAVRDGSNDFAFFKDGSRVASTSSSLDFTLDYDFVIGINGDDFYDAPSTIVNPLNGFMSEVRISDTARYDPALASISVPTAQFEDDTNTLMLLRLNEAALSDVANSARTITANGVSNSTSDYKFATVPAVAASTNVPTTGVLSLPELLQASYGGLDGGGFTFDMGYTAAGQNKSAPNSQRAWCLERDTSYGYTGYAWFKNASANTATQYYWSGSAWTSQNVTRTFTALSNGWLGLADSGTLLCAVDSNGNISIVNKSTGSQVASASHNNNLQGVLWDGTYFWAGSYTTPQRAVRITTSGVTTNYTLPSSSGTGKIANRSAFYDFNKNYYYFGDYNAAHAYTFNGSSFTFVGQETSTEWTSQEGEYFEQSDGSKYLIAHNSTNLTSLTPV